jgi:tetratricopeptide (TPR) repeat protein
LPIRKRCGGDAADFFEQRRQVMNVSDVRGAPVSTANRVALDGFEHALRQFQCYRGDPVATIDQVLTEDPTFVMGHILKAAVQISMWEQSVVPEVANTMSRLKGLGNRANERERAFTAAIEAWTEGDWQGMRAKLDRHTIAFPTDALALQLGHLADFYHGDRDNLRGRIARALPYWTAEMSGYGFMLGMYTFGQEECGDYRRAEETGRRAVSLEPDDCWAHHAVAHVMEMEARQAEGIAWMEDRREYWAQPDNAFAFHNTWHTALFHLDQGDAARALALYDAGVRPGNSQIQLEMVDAAALLWRMHLQGIDVGGRWSGLADSYERAGEAGFYAFNDMHAMMAFVGAGRQAAAEMLMTAVERAAAASGSGAGGKTNAMMTDRVGLPIVHAIAAYGRGQYATVVDLLMPVRYAAHAFGGSHAQRDIVHRTLQAAAMADGQFRLAEALAAERTALKPHCPFSWRLCREARAAMMGTSIH